MQVPVTQGLLTATSQAAPGIPPGGSQVVRVT